jgi:hypothetical protein
MLGVIQLILIAFDPPHGCSPDREQMIKFAFNPQGAHGCPNTVLFVFLSSLHSNWCSRFTTLQQCLNRKWNVEAGAYRGVWASGSDEDSERKVHLSLHFASISALFYRSVNCLVTLFWSAICRST